MTQQMLAVVGPLISAVAFVTGTAWLLLKLRNSQRDRFVAVTNTLFQIWQAPDFMRAQLWIIHEMSEVSWEEFQDARTGKEGESDFWRVTGYYNRVGTIIQLRLVGGDSILRTIGATACAVWRKIAPLLDGARQHNPGFLQDFERLIPRCTALAVDQQRTQKRRGRS